MSKLGAGPAHAADGDARTRKRSTTSSPIRRLAAAVAALALGAGLAVVGVAAPASAHHNSISGNVVCEADGTASIEWTVTNSESKKTETIVVSSDEETVPVGTTLGEAESKTFIQSDVEPGKYVLKLTGEWKNADGSTVTKANESAEVKVKRSDCKAPPQKITICHATASEKNPYNRITIARSAVVAHLKHQGYEDITPAFTYKGVSYPAQGDPALLQSKDCTKPKPTEIELPAKPESVDACGVLGDHIVQPDATPGVSWKIGEVAGGTATATATADDGYIFSNGEREISWDFEFTDRACPITIQIPAQPAKIDLCGVVDDRIADPGEAKGISWEIGTVVDGKATATARTVDGYVFTDGSHEKAWELTFTNEPCPLPVPAEPIFTDACGVDGDGVTYDSTAQHVRWEVAGDPKAGGEVIVTAVAEDGYVFPKGETSLTWKHDFTNKACPPQTIPVVGVPDKVDRCGVDDDELVLPDTTGEHMSWKVDGDPKQGGRVVVTAVADEGYAFEDGATTDFEFDFDSTPCPKEIPVPAAPTAVELCGVDNDDVLLPESTDEVVWSEKGLASDGEVIVTAKTTDGFVFPGGKREMTFVFTFTDEDCFAPVLDGSLATGTCLANAPWIVYDVKLTDPDQLVTERTVHLVLSDGEHTESIELGELDEDGVLEGRALWPGASVDDEGNPTGWPGWKQLGDGTWVQTDDNFGWTRDLTSAKFVVNPEFEVKLAYPPAAPDCIAAPPVTPGEPGGTGETPSTPAGDGLASTGFAGTTIAIVAGVVVLAGIAFLVIARLRRKQS